MMMEKDTSKIAEQSSNTSSEPEGSSWSNPGKFPDFAGNTPKSNIEKLQELLDRTGFTELRKNPAEFNNFLEQTSTSDLHRYLQHVNQNLREATMAERGFHEGRMFVGGMISPDRDTQITVLDNAIGGISKIDNDKYRSALAYYQINSLHLFPDANGRTARAVYTILRQPDFDLNKSADYITHADNRSQSDSSGNKVSEFEKLNGLASPREFTQYSMLETLKTLQKEDPEFGEELEPISQTMDFLLTQEPRRRANIVSVIGASTGSEAGKELYALKKNPAYQELNDDERQRFNYALCDNNALVSVAGLAMLKFHQEKGDLPHFLAEHTKQNPALGGLSQCLINIDPDDEEYFGSCECKDWSATDMRKYTTIAEEIKRRQLETGTDIFVNPELHTNSSGEKIANLLIKA